MKAALHPMKHKLVTTDEALPAKRQHVMPCADCPFSRNSLRGWLGPMSDKQWMKAAHGEGRIDCHTSLGAQCAGAAIFRANICKMPRSPEVLLLERNTKLVFTCDDEFYAHHGKKAFQ